MARKKIKKFLKKALPLAALGLGAAALAKRKRHLGVKDQDDAGLGVSHFKDYITKKATPPVDEGIWGSPWGAKGGGIAKRGFGRALMKGKK